MLDDTLRNHIASFMYGVEYQTVVTWIIFCLKIDMILVSLQYFNQILTVVLEVLDDSESSIRELALLLISEMLKNQVCLISFLWSILWMTFWLFSSDWCYHLQPNRNGENERESSVPYSITRVCCRYFHVYSLHSLCCDILVTCFQGDAMEDSVEIVIEKLLHVAKDIVPKVTFFSWTTSFPVITFFLNVSW